MSQRDKIKLKIQALLSKTTDNGATEAEAIAALKKANELMMAYYIDENELTDPHIGEKCVSESVDIIQTGYDTRMFFGILCRLFDCCHFYNHYRIVFFGHEQDVKLCAFFYSLITRACLTEKDKYIKSESYKYDSRYCHGRTLCASFVKGFLYKVCIKMEEMYENRHSSIPHEMGIVLANKKDKVRGEFDTVYADKKITRAKPTALSGLIREGFDEGAERGEKFNLTQGIDSHTKANQLMLEL